MPSYILTVRTTALFLVLTISLSLMAGCSSKTAREHFEEAERILGNGQYQAALEKYNFIADNFQNTSYAPRSLYKAGFIYNRLLGEKRMATRAYYTLYSVYPKSPEAYAARRDLAEMYSKAGDHTKAVEQYQWLIDNNQTPGDRERFMYVIALEYFKMNDFQQTRAELKEVLASTKNQDVVVDALFLEANSYYLEGDTQGAIYAYERIISEFPDHEKALEARFNLAKALEESDKPKEALVILEALKDEYPNRDAVTSSIEWIQKRLKEKKSRRRRRRR